MAYLVYARKYRPKTFEEMVGQKAVVQTLQNAIRSGRVAQAYLFSGMRGVGKTTAARILAKALNCVNGPTPTPCNVCEFCTAIDEDRLVDVLEIDGASNRGIDDIRQLRESVQYKAMHSRYKVIYIDEVHQITKDGFNALLKTLEEPPPQTLFIFATTEFHKVPATIVSRCQHFEFKRVSQREMVNHLNFVADKEKLTVTPYGLSLIAEASEGSIRDAQSLLDQAVAFCGESIGDADLREILGAIDRGLFFDFSAAVREEKAERIFSLTERVVEAGHDLRHFFKELIHHFRNLLLVRTVDNPQDLLFLSAEDMARFRDEAALATSDEWLRWLQALQAAEAGLRFASHPQIYFETILVRLCHFKHLVPLRDLIQDVEALKKNVPADRGGETRAAGPSPLSIAARPAATKTSPRPAANPAAPAAEAKAPAENPPLSPSGSAASAGEVPTSERAPAASRDADKAMALKDPAVNLFMKKFKARITAVEPPATKRDEED